MNRKAKLEEIKRILISKVMDRDAMEKFIMAFDLPTNEALREMKLEQILEKAQERQINRYLEIMESKIPATPEEKTEAIVAVILEEVNGWPRDEAQEGAKDERGIELWEKILNIIE